MTTNKVACVVAWLTLLPVAWASEFMVRAERAYVNEIATRFGLTVLQKVPGQDLFRVRGPANASVADVLNWVKNYDHGDNDNDDDDDDDVLIEENVIVSLVETAPGPSPRGSDAPARNALADRSSTTFFGDTLWSGFVKQPALAHIRVAAAHRQLATGAGVVAVIDTGIDPFHPALRRWLVPGYDFIRESAGFPSELDDLDPETRALLNPYTTAILDGLYDINPYTTAILDGASGKQLDPTRLPVGFGHGTMVAGLVRLVAPTARIMPLKPFGGDGKATRFNVIRAIYFAAAKGARVINLSLGFETSSPEMELAIRTVSAQGVVCIASAGNRGLETMAYPAGYKESIGVASTNLLDQRSLFSNYGDDLVRVAAPGEGLIAPYPGGRYAAVWGTSFSAPLVAGTVALMIAVKPQLGWEWADGALSEAAPAAGGLGSGRLDVFRAVDKVRQF
jgi:subtilisin family serine protease